MSSAVILQGVVNSRLSGHVNEVCLRRQTRDLHHRSELRESITRLIREHATFVSTVLPAAARRLRPPGDDDLRAFKHGRVSLPPCLLPLLPGALLRLIADFSGVKRGQQLRNAREAKAELVIVVKEGVERLRQERLWQERLERQQSIKRKVCTDAEDEALRRAIHKHGAGSWARIKKNPDFAQALADRSPGNIKGRWRNLLNHDEVMAIAVAASQQRGGQEVVTDGACRACPAINISGLLGRPAVLMKGRSKQNAAAAARTATAASYLPSSSSGTSKARPPAGPSSVAKLSPKTASTGAARL